MRIDGYTRTCGLIGNPVEHTMSPVIHNTLAAATGENLVYVPFHVPQGHVEEAVKGAWALNVLGVNVTVPYKSEVIPFLCELDPLAKQIGAVNTLVRTEGGFKGYNTDMPGLYRAMCGDGVRLENEDVLILGAGGVARAVAILLAKKGAATVTILNRTVDRADKIAEEVNVLTGRDFARALPLEGYRELSDTRKYLAVQATSVGMFPHTEDVIIEDDRFYDKIHTGYDLIFNPLKTRFMELVQAHGGRAFNGYRMLLYQGVIAYELWTGKQVDDTLAGAVYEKMQRAMAVNCSDKED
ncbi:MAG: shikimate dehydrogenase [Candidatus Gastranaerophilales bacterium]|nr:shikimate dehydrogenase [Candidatus Gastranaerophilales bacterium]